MVVDITYNLGVGVFLVAVHKQLTVLTMGTLFYYQAPNNVEATTMTIITIIIKTFIWLLNLSTAVFQMEIGVFNIIQMRVQHRK